MVGKNLKIMNIGLLLELSDGIIDMDDKTASPQAIFFSL